MFMRTAICLTFILFAGAALAEWQSLPQTGPQAVSRVIQASLALGANSMETAGARHVSRPEVEALIRQGNKRMREGDILGARQSYREAFASGEAAAALVMARSYDPIYFALITERNAEPEPTKAFEWYGRAREAGAVRTAMVRIEDLKRFMSR
jgi:hypothetical protein